MSINECYPSHTRAPAKAGFNMKIFQLLRNCGKTKTSRRKIKNKNVKGRGEGNITLMSVIYSHNCGGRRSIVSLKDPERPMDQDGL